MVADIKTHTDISVTDNSTDVTVYAPDPQIRQNYDAFVKYIRDLALKMRGYDTNEDAGPKPIASYRAAGKTNEDADRAVLKDLTGNGHDLQLKNFAFSGSSGYGLYDISSPTGWWYYGITKVNLTKYSVQLTDRSHTNQDLLIFFEHGSSQLTAGTYNFTGFRFKITNPNNHPLSAFFRGDKSLWNIDATESGIYEFPDITLTLEEDANTNYGFELATDKEIENFSVIFELLPKYEGALVFDGVDDYAICENFPILTKEKGYTVVALRQWIEEETTITALVSNSKNWNQDGAFVFEYNYLDTTSGNYAISFGTIVSVAREESPFTYQLSKLYNGKNINPGDFAGSNELIVGKGNKNLSPCSNIAIWKLDIFDHDLTEEEIQKVKDQYKEEYPELLPDQIQTLKAK